MFTTLALVGSLAMADPGVAAPRPGWTGAGLIAVGGVGKALGFGAGLFGVALGGSPGLMITTAAIGPSVLGGGAMVTGAWLRARHQAFYRAEDLGHRVRPARRAGWVLVGVGAGLLVASSVALATWPFEPVLDDGAAARYPGAFAGVGAVFCVAPLAIGAGASAVTWADTYAGHRRPRVVVAPTGAGLRVDF